jgi:FtsP/CotA-like multicopper oxidase with cupredoxin domain
LQRPSFFDYYYPMRDPGFSTGEHEKDDRPSTLWYHDHPGDFTAANVYKGLAGFFLAFDEFDTGDETRKLFPDTNLQLPSGPFDIPLLFQDKSFDAKGQLIFDPFNDDGFLGDQFLVNGKIQPYLNVQRRKYRFRCLNGSNARVYQLFLSKTVNGPTFPFHHIATEGGLLTTPFLRNNDGFRLAPAERVEVVIDFTQFQVGDKAYVENRLEQTDGRRPDGLGKGTQLLEFRVVQAVGADPSQVYTDLHTIADGRRAKDPITEAEKAGATRREFKFDRSGGAWAINGQFEDFCKPMAQIPVNAGSKSSGRPGEIWRLVNSSGGWVHPIHIHLEYAHVLSRNGRTPPLDERDGNALKDTLYLGPGDEVEVFMHFRDFTGPYVFHCHNLEHEDMFMMALFNVHK